MDSHRNKEKQSTGGDGLPQKRGTDVEEDNEDPETSIIVKQWTDKKTKKYVICCPRETCTFRTKEKGYSMKTARIHLFKHMLSDDLCKSLTLSCTFCRKYHCIKSTEEHLLKCHLSWGTCQEYQNIKPVIDGQALPFRTIHLSPMKLLQIDTNFQNDL